MVDIGGMLEKEGVLTRFLMTKKQVKIRAEITLLFA